MKAISSTLKFYHDPGHGWLQVPMKDIDTLGIRADISSFSFIAGTNAYLEEDCDCGVYLRAVERAGLAKPDITEVSVDHFDRNTERF